MESTNVLALAAKHDAALQAAPRPAKPRPAATLVSPSRRGREAGQMTGVVSSPFAVIVSTACGILAYPDATSLALAGLFVILIPAAASALLGSAVGIAAWAMSRAGYARRASTLEAKHQREEVDYREKMNRHLEARSAAEAELAPALSGSGFTYEVSNSGLKLIRSQNSALVA